MMGGNLWVEIDQVSKDSSSSENIAASLEASLSYMTASGTLSLGNRSFKRSLFSCLIAKLVSIFIVLFVLAGSIKASYSQEKKDSFSESSSRVRFVANGGDPISAKLVTEVGDRGSDSDGFVENLNTWLTTIKEKPQIAKFALQPVFDVGAVAQILLFCSCSAEPSKHLTFHFI
jgi:hypothetical protein